MTLNIVTTPSILTDTIFADYGGHTGTATAAQCQAAYAIAEAQAAQEIGTFVSPTTVTGTYSWPPMGQPLKLEHSRLISVVSVTAIHEAGCDCAADSVEIEGCAWVLDPDNGVVDLRECGNTLKASCAGCGCGNEWGMPKQVRIVYWAGLPATAANDPRLLLGLVTAADLALEQMIDPSGAEGGPGDPGVQSFGTQGYSENRTPLKRGAFGSSARANYAAQMLSHFKFKGALKLGW
jgi:hypothetical protein